MTERTRNTLLIALALIVGVGIPFIVFPVALINSIAPVTRELVVADPEDASCVSLDDDSYLLTVPIVGTDGSPLSNMEFDSSEGLGIVRVGLVPRANEAELLVDGGTNQLAAQSEGSQRLGYLTSEPSVLAIVIETHRSEATSTGLTIKSILGEVNSKQQIGLGVTIVDEKCSIAPTSSE